MKKFAERLGLLSAIISVIALIRLPVRAFVGLEQAFRRTRVPPVGTALKWGMSTPLVFAKTVGTLFAPLVLLTGLTSALLGVASCNGAALLSGGLAALLSLRHTRRVTAPHDGFERAFGPDWPDRIPDSLWPKLSARRWQVSVRQINPILARRRRDVIYGKHEDGHLLTCDVWLPPEEVTPTGLGVLYFHGTAWQALDKGMVLGSVFRRLAAQGHVVADVRYTLAPAADMFGIMRDVQRAIAWMKSDGAEFGVKPERVVLWGTSGGGHLALLAAYTPAHPRFQPDGDGLDLSVRGVISAYGPTDLTAHWYEYASIVPAQPEFSDQSSLAMQPYVHDTTRLDLALTRARIWPAFRYANTPDSPLLLVGLLGGTLLEVPDNYRLCSPLAHVSTDCPPTLQLWGEHDFYVSPTHGRRLHRALCEAGAKSIYVEYPTTDHGFDALAPALTPVGQSMTYDIEHFLAMLV